ncbi:hypothetical protein EX30DRAFT_122718 [Ascodesmis nigricans]|uniref:C2H2-type domain-containing protein n=1 Tax=Ascodesmis nigricans TaxID=341454 RepID=A0A4S2MPJ6_9PEZI|nr:hypothetical protein EX30DRAFT_122718 [Ascodesmis nigricans]
MVQSSTTSLSNLSNIEEGLGSTGMDLDIDLLWFPEIAVPQEEVKMFADWERSLSEWNLQDEFLLSPPSIKDSPGHDPVLPSDGWALSLDTLDLLDLFPGHDSSEESDFLAQCWEYPDSHVTLSHLDCDTSPKSIKEEAKSNHFTPSQSNTRCVSPKVPFNSPRKSESPSRASRECSSERESPDSFPCPRNCGQIFRRNNALQRHIISIHERPGVQCPFCVNKGEKRRRFNRSDNFQRHMKRHQDVGPDNEILRK